MAQTMTQCCLNKRRRRLPGCNASKDIIGYSADPKNGFHIVGNETFVNDDATYDRKLLAFKVACVRLVNANGAVAAVNKLDQTSR